MGPESLLQNWDHCQQRRPTWIYNNDLNVPKLYFVQVILMHITILLLTQTIHVQERSVNVVPHSLYRARTPSSLSCGPGAYLAAVQGLYNAIKLLNWMPATPLWSKLPAGYSWITPWYTRVMYWNFI